MELNITRDPQPLRSKENFQQQPFKSQKKVKRNNGTPDSFSFKFDSGPQKIKAIVARKRPATKTTNTMPATLNTTHVGAELQAKPTIAKFSQGPKVSTTTPLKSIAFKRKSQQATQEQRKCFVLAPSKSEAESNFEDADIEGDIELNITSVPVEKPQRTVKLNRTERLNKKNMPKSRTEQASKVSKKPQGNEKPIPVTFKVPENETAVSKETEEPSEETRKPNAFRSKPSHHVSALKMKLFEDNMDATPLGQRLVKPITERIFDGTKVDTIGLHPHAVKNLADLLSISELTTVQKKTIPQALAGKDVLVRSQTGSGKTLAYALPVVEKLQEIRPKVMRTDGILAVIIVPTRELGMQTYELFQKLLKPFTWLVAGVLMGGERRKAEKARLRKGINILIGTPGRLVDHLLHTESFKVNKAKFLVLDEADRLLEMGYERDVKQIVEAIDKQRAQLTEETKAPATHLQRMLLSATLTAAVKNLAGLTLREPIYIDNSNEEPSDAIRHSDGYTKETIEAATVEQSEVEDAVGVLTIPENLQLSYVVVPPKLRLVTLSGLLAKEFVGKTKFKAVVFMSTTEMVGYHHDLLNETLTQKVLDEEDEEIAREIKRSKSANDEEPLLKGLRFFKLYGSMTQTERQGVFKSFRECKSGVLLATDVVGRGIDVPEIDLVVQYSPPQKTADFVHRVGRTARAGRSGRALLFLAPSEVQFVRYLENKRIRISPSDMNIYLNALKAADAEAHNMQEAASNLQHTFEVLLEEDRELHDKGCKDAPTSFAKKHSQPKPPPPTNRLTYTERDPEKIKAERRAKKRSFTTTVTGAVRDRNRPMKTNNQLMKMLPKSRALTISEFDSGLPAPKKKK